ncbi:MAG: ribonucleoside-diphosphate reductase, adenosylcobalamin-dependent [Thaumarchaeota archaeon]|nr:ribonucleoside-diphosphate reductase, adenosylcobalamin-dependent [Nitrososphaerota archaeon]
MEINDILSENVMKVLKARYLLKFEDGRQESPDELFLRVAGAIASADEEYQDFDSKESKEIFYKMMKNFEFLPNSPTLMNAGAPLGQLSACFVLPVEDETSSIMDAVKTQAIVQKTGGGTGFSFSKLRPEGDQVGSTGSVASGPVSFMQLFDKCTQVIKQGGKRRGANMGIVNIEHPDVLEFIEMKRNNMKLPEEAKIMKEFNVSVAITDDFMSRLEKEDYHKFINPRTGEEVLKCNKCRKNVFPKQNQAECSLCDGKGERIKAKELWGKIIDCAWECADPGLIFIDKINNSNSNPVREHFKIESTNPCGEVPLLPNESCNLGSINVAKFTNEENNDIDWDKLRECTRNAIHFLDNVVTKNQYPTKEIEELSRNMRRLGLGVMGLADLLSKLKIKYGSDESFRFSRKLMKFISEVAWKMSEELAENRGTFPYWDKSDFAKIGRKVRNVNCTIIAPTGSIGTIANCSPGIEPHFALVFVRHSRIKERSEEFEELHYLNESFAIALKEHNINLDKEKISEISANGGSIQNLSWIPREIKEMFPIAADLSGEQHVLMQSAFQEFVDDGVSKTINLANEATKEDVNNSYRLAYNTHCKGITVYRDGCLDVQVLETDKTKNLRGDNKDKQSAHVLPGGYKRPEFLVGRTYRFTYTNSGLFITINRDQEGRPREVFIERGKSGDEEKAAYEGMGRLISIALQSDVDVKAIIKTMRGIQTKNVSWHQTKGTSIPIRSVPDAVAHALADSIHTEPEVSIPETEEIKNELLEITGSSSNNMSKCTACGEMSLIYAEGCSKCLSCSYSSCG